MTSLVCFTMDNLGDAADLGRGVIQQPRAPGQRPYLEVGFPAMLELYARHEVRVTHFIEGWNGEAHPEAVRRVIEHGHDLGMHGWQHENWAQLEEGRARELAERATEALRRAAGVSPRAFRAPGGRRTTATADLLKSLGYHIDASLDPAGQDGGPPAPLGGGLWTVPYEWDAVDASHWLWRQRNCEDVKVIWKRMLEGAAAGGRAMTFIWHPHVMGMDPAKLAVGDAILRFVREDPRFTVVTLPELVAHCRRQQEADQPS